MTQSERFGIIERMLLSRRSVTFAELQQRLEVSRATLHRDLRDLRERMQVPIVYERETGTYHIDSSVERYELPGVWFSAGEIHALLSMQQLLNAFDSGGLLAEHVGPLRQRLLGMLESATDSADDIGRDKVASVLDFFLETPERYGHDLLGPQALADYYTHYFFERQKDMVYAVSPKEAKAIGRNDSLLSLLSENGLSLAEARRKGQQISTRLLNQSFMSAAEAFKAIDSPTQGVVVPWGKAGADLIGRLHGAYDISLEGELLREAQQFTVNVFPHVFDKLSKAEALHVIKEGVRIYSLDPRYYSKQFGLATEPVSLMETLNV